MESGPAKSVRRAHSLTAASNYNRAMLVLSRNHCSDKTLFIPEERFLLVHLTVYELALHCSL